MKGIEEVEIGGVMCLRSKRKTDWATVLMVGAGLVIVGGLYGLAVVLSM